MKRIILTLIILVLMPYTFTNTIYADNSNDIKSSIEDCVNGSLDKIDFGDFEKYLEDNFGDKELIDDTCRGYVEGIIKGDFKIGFGELMSVSTKYIFKDIMSFFPLIILILSISILFSIVDGMSSKFTSKSTTEIIYFVSYITIIVAVTTVLGLIMNEAIGVTQNIVKFMNIIFPVLLTLMTALGGTVSVQAYKPMMLVLSSTISGIITKLVIPIFIATIVFSIVGNLSKNIKLENMTKSIKSVGVFVLGGLFSLFTTFVTIEGITGTAIDSVSIKSAKFAISSYVPILGGYLSDGFDIALASMVLIKNAVGFVGIMVILLLTILPVIKIAIFTLVLRLTSGIIEPICDERISSFIYGVSENMPLLIAVVLGVAFMFFIVCMLVILTLNVVI